MSKKLAAVFTAIILITIIFTGCGKVTEPERGASSDISTAKDSDKIPDDRDDSDDGLSEEDDDYTSENSGSEEAVTWTVDYETGDAPVGDETKAGFSLTMLDVGEGLCLLFCADGKYMLYDGGGRETSSYVVSYLNAHGVTELDLVVASHYDEDHIGGLIGALYNANVNAFWGPDYQAETSIYTSLVNALDSAGLTCIHPSVGDEFALGGATVKVVSASADAALENDRSVAVIVTYGETKVLVTGDCESAAESAMVSAGVLEPVDIYVVAHHGAAASSNKAFLAEVKPAYAFLSCGLGNENMHPSREALLNLSECKAKLFRTDIQGEVTAFSDGSSLWFSTADTSDWRNGTQMTIVDGEGTENVSEPQDYILNTNSKRFHYPSCDSVSDMSERNKKEVHMSREEIINMGYESCGRCHP